MPNQKGLTPLVIILGVVLILGIAFGAYYFGNQSIKTPLPSPSPSSANSTSGLKTYTNSKYKFSIQYPNDWVLVPYASPDVMPGFKPENDPNYKDAYQSAFNIREGCYDPEVKKLDFKQWVASSAAFEVQGYSKLKSMEELTSNSGVKGYRVTWGTFIMGGGAGEAEVTYIKLPAQVDKYNCLEFESGGPYSDIENQIFSSFKFTN